MKAGVTASIVAHIAFLALGVVSLAAPPPLAVPDVEALPIDIVPIESLTKSIQGDRKAKPKTPPAPKQTKRKTQVRDAKNVGDTKSSDGLQDS